MTRSEEWAVGSKERMTRSKEWTTRPKERMTRSKEQTVPAALSGRSAAMIG